MLKLQKLTNWSSHSNMSSAWRTQHIMINNLPFFFCGTFRPELVGFKRKSMMRSMMERFVPLRSMSSTSQICLRPGIVILYGEKWDKFHACEVLSLPHGLWTVFVYFLCVAFSCCVWYAVLSPCIICMVDSLNRLFLLGKNNCDINNNITQTMSPIYFPWNL